MSDNDEKHPPVDISGDEHESDVDNDEDDEVDEKSKLLSSRETSPTPSNDKPDQDPRFNRPTPSRFKRFALIVFLVSLLWLAYQMRKSLWEGKKKPQVIHASRYSKEHKFRPAASPIITETLKDGRIRLRGALPEPTEAPKPVAKPKTKKTSTGKVTGKKRARKTKRKATTAEKRM